MIKKSCEKDPIEEKEEELIQVDLNQLSHFSRRGTHQTGQGKRNVPTNHNISLSNLLDEHQRNLLDIHNSGMSDEEMDDVSFEAVQEIDK